MAPDNTQLPPTGTGTADIKVATRTVTYSGDAGVNAQVMGIVAFAGSDDAKTVADVPGDATNGLFVNATLVSPGTAAANLGKAEDAVHASGDVGVQALGVRADTLAATAANGDYVPLLVDSLGAQYVVSEERLVSITVTPTVSTSPAYTSGDAMGGLMTFSNAARFSGGPIVVESVIITCKTPALLPILELVLWDRTVTASTDNAANSISDADMLNTIGVVPAGPWIDYANNSVATRTAVGLAAVLNGTDLFGQLVTRSTPTLGATTDIQVKVVVRQG